MRCFILLHALLVLAACSPSPIRSASSPPPPATPSGAALVAAPEEGGEDVASFPATITGFGAMSFEVYPDPRLGVGYHYDGGGTRCSVYAYDRGYGHIPTGIDSEIVRLEFDEARRDIRLAASRGVYKELRELGTSQRVVDVSAGKISFMRADYSFVLRGKARHSVLFLTGSRSRFLKLRCTWLSDDNARGKQKMEHFLHEVTGHYLQ